MKLYRVDVILHATAYVKAVTAQEAEAKAYDKIDGQEVMLNPVDELVSRLPFNDPDLPEVSLSPSVTGEIDVGDSIGGEFAGIEEVEEETFP